MRLFILLALALFLTACRPDDSYLTRLAHEALAAQGLAGITITVNGGAATLTGQVAEADEKARAEATVRAIPGITSVNNTLTLKPDATAVNPATRAKLNEKLRKAGCMSVSVDIHDGIVTALGTATAVKYAECLHIIDDEHLGKIDNQLVMSK